MTKVTITYEQLDSKDACEGQLKLFKKTFPNGISVTSEEELVAIAKKFSKKFDMFWASENLLSGESYDKYKEVQQLAHDKYKEVEQQAVELQALQKFRAVEQQAWELPRAVEQQAWELPRIVELQALQKFRAVEQQAWELPRAVEQQAYDKYKKSIAIVFAKLYYQQESTKVEGS